MSAEETQPLSSRSLGLAPPAYTSDCDPLTDPGDYTTDAGHPDGLGAQSRRNTQYFQALPALDRDKHLDLYHAVLLRVAKSSFILLSILPAAAGQNFFFLLIVIC